MPYLMDRNMIKPNKKITFSLNFGANVIFNRLDVSNSTIVRNNYYANTLDVFASRLIILSHP
jgi:hypothetical protein